MLALRRGVTLVELLISVTLLGVLLGLIVQASVTHLQLHRTMHAREVQLRSMQHAVRILAAELAPLSAEGGDLIAGEATDSAVEIQSLLGAAVTCMVSGTTVRIPPASLPAGAGLASYVATPSVGDRLLAFDDDSEPERWLTRTIVQVRSGGAVCSWAQPSEGFTLTLDSALFGEQFVPVRITRRTRYSLYRGGDRQWYLGMRDWDATSGRFNTIQPVSGPYNAYSAAASSTGLRFTYVDTTGRTLSTPVVDGSIVGRVEVVVRAASGVDSLQLLVALRHAP